MQTNDTGKKINAIKTVRYLAGPILSGMLVTQAAAADYQSHASIKGAARQFVLDQVTSVYKQRPEVETGSLDSRLRLRKCTLPLEAYLPGGSRDIGRLTVGVRCGDAKPWSLYVPVTVSLYRQVVVAARTLPRDTVLSAGDIKLARFNLSELSRGYIEDTQSSLGMKLKRRIGAGDPLTPAMMEKPRIIERGQMVTIIAGTSGMQVRTTGKALAHGAAGERIRVLNLSSEQKLEGTVTPSGEVRVDI